MTSDTGALPPPRPLLALRERLSPASSRSWPRALDEPDPPPRLCGRMKSRRIDSSGAVADRNVLEIATIDFGTTVDDGSATRPLRVGTPKPRGTRLGTPRVPEAYSRNETTTRFAL